MSRLEVARTVEGYPLAHAGQHLLSNRRYTVMLTDSGAGYSSWRGRAVTRWREDARAGLLGQLHLPARSWMIRRLWSAGFQPTAGRCRMNTACTSTKRARCIARARWLAAHHHWRWWWRPMTTANCAGSRCAMMAARPRSIELTSYAEVVLAPPRADIAHPAFSNLFVQTEFVPAAARCWPCAARAASDEAPLGRACHRGAADSAAAPLQYETDRCRFIGRGHGTRTAAGAGAGQRCPDTAGNVLDPVFSLRTRVNVPPRASVSVTFATFVAESREQALALAVKYRTRRCSTMWWNPRWTFARADLHYLRSTLGEAMLFQPLASHLLMSDAAAARRRRPAASATRWMSRTCGATPSRATGPSCWSAATATTTCPSSSRCCARRNTCASSRCVVDVVILNERRHLYMQRPAAGHRSASRAVSAPAGDGRRSRRHLHAGAGCHEHGASRRCWCRWRAW